MRDYSGSTDFVLHNIVGYGSAIVHGRKIEASTRCYAEGVWQWCVMLDDGYSDGFDARGGVAGSEREAMALVSEATLELLGAKLR